MKIGALALLFLSIAVSAFAGADRVQAPGPVDLPGSRDAIYCQTTSTDWNALNASSGFNSELVDDIPDAYAGFPVSDVTFYVAEWSGGWTPFTSMTVNFYDASCPPNQTADFSFEVPYWMCTVEQVYAGDWFVYSVLVPLPTAITIETMTSIGGVVNQDWGQSQPFCGLVICDAVADCGGYWAGDFWGYPRWSPVSSLMGYDVDIAYCLGYTGIGGGTYGACCFADDHCEMRSGEGCGSDGGQFQGDGTSCDPNPCVPSPAKSTTWGQIRGTYR
jgi:hypothetical protein